MTHVPGFDTKMRRNEQSWQTLDIDNMLRPTFSSKNSQYFSLMNKIIEKFAILLIPIFLYRIILHHLMLLQIWHIIHK